jgi:hypothetical protein
LVISKNFIYFQIVSAVTDRFAASAECLYRKFGSFIFFCGLFFLGVYNGCKVKTVGGSDSILFNFRKGVW